MAARARGQTGLPAAPVSRLSRRRAPAALRSAQSVKSGCLGSETARPQISGTKGETTRIRPSVVSPGDATRVARRTLEAPRLAPPKRCRSRGLPCPCGRCGPVACCPRWLPSPGGEGREPRETKGIRAIPAGRPFPLSRRRARPIPVPGSARFLQCEPAGVPSWCPAAPPGDRSFRSRRRRPRGMALQPCGWHALCITPATCALATQVETEPCEPLPLPR